MVVEVASSRLMILRKNCLEHRTLLMVERLWMIAFRKAPPEMKEGFIDGGTTVDDQLQESSPWNRGRL